jgi:SNF2 family DNA or RNA helicase
MLPEEWVSKFGRIITGGKVKKDNLGFSQIQYGLIDHLYGEIHNNHSLLEFHQKRQKLLAFETIEHKALPENINATLRDYQIGGFQWLHFLDEFGWGGCLADDMGLGKTLQMLTFIQSKVNENPETKILVVVPASLIFNWQREAEKFTPFLKVLKHTGTTREKEHSLFNKHHIILTTYALMRIDIESLKDFEFDYVILDESQAIKNPSAQTAKAAKILKAKNRLIMTGTPIENNTFDLYSQFDFLNPGLLGSVDYFREQFANPIDKERDEKAAEALRRLIYPFIISRKKEQVAKELPPKTETVIFCEMGKAQRKVYDTYKNKIREDLTKTIEEQGLGKSGIAVLQGLTKLRQICNSPALLSDDDISIHDSVKLDTLMENIIPVIEENHKVLIFSFFVEMLELVKARIQKENIQYAWITGQTTQREQQVQNFQQDENCKVFLISLKAGGVGLNLTAADYVYLIDPWWNPAVEQQAIDRAHRIGQTQNVFAYKMICKDTIEEKILQLQEKKKAVASELVNIEQGVLKKLSKDDVLTLFE